MRYLQLLATDLDGTLAGNTTAIRNFKSFVYRCRHRPHLIYVTGRHVRSAIELMERCQLPRPAVLITDIGAAIYTGHLLTEDMRWAHQMRTNWDPASIVAASRQVKGLEQQTLPNIKRVSFLTDSPAAVETLESILATRNIAHQCIYSADAYVDILPLCSGKGNALSYVLGRLYPRITDILVAGDSGNDTAMLSLGYPAVLVGNAHPEVRPLAARPGVYQARAPYAAGILEGWQHFYSTSSY